MTPRNTPYCTCVILPILVVLVQMLQALLRRSAWRICFLPFKVTHFIGTNRYRCATYDFLLTFHSNHGHMSYRFCDKRRFESNIAIFFLPQRIMPSLRVFRLEFGTSTRVKKTRIMGLTGWQRTLTIYSAVWIQCTNVTDGRTDTGRQQRQIDGHWPIAKTTLMYSVAR